ncbi:DUF2141 domain-containing protein [Qipengyuania sp. YG27]|uniref:DUF2141 domain-containing protein n=1 Tax=Qipengyuania mesophila TaxID=2867246 RepID=A0ABS7JX67_9SPHN|nr:DUF2141 domain-containing protein [Qipengyuania mesophila]MBX7502167.1 DUF2141 domain-containing protein [Qipengyuania mesophila]
MRVAASILVLPLLASATLPSTPDLGKEEGRCRPQEAGPSFVVEVRGLKDRTGNLKLEVYPANDKDFLEDDNILVSAGKTFRRVEVPVPNSGTPSLCVRLPAAGTYGVSILHDRDSNRKFGWRVDGIGFAGNPKLGWSKPKVANASARAGSGPTRIAIVMNYRKGFSMRPLEGR